MMNLSSQVEESIKEHLDHEGLILPERIIHSHNEGTITLLRPLKNCQKVVKNEINIPLFRPRTININSTLKKNDTFTRRTVAYFPGSVDNKMTRKRKTFDKLSSPRIFQKSLIKEYEFCESKASREEFRKKAIKVLVESKQLPHLEHPGDFLTKYKKAIPYYVFFSNIKDSPKTWKHSNSITFPEILDKSLGEIEESLHITDKIDTIWLRLQYALAGQKTNSTILYSRRLDKFSLPTTIKIYNFDQKSKITILKYKNGVRIVMPSANLYSDDWYYRTQTVWISPHLPFLSKNLNLAEGESKTGFKQTFIKYLMELGLELNAKINIKKWLDLCSTLDFSMINVFFIGCVPGKSSNWGLSGLAQLLIKYIELDNGDDWPIVIQNSITTNFSFESKYWLNHELLYELSFYKGRELGHHENYASQNNPELFLIYPTKKNFDNSSDPLAHKNNKKKYPLSHSDWKIIKQYAHEWKSESQGRDRAMPGCNYYMRISLDMDRVPWVIITSSNLGDFSWGYKVNDEHKNQRDCYHQELRINCSNESEQLSDKYLEVHSDNYAAGILFLPKFLTGQTTFPIQEADENGTPPFPVPFDFHFKEYNHIDKPLIFKDYSGNAKDCIFKKRKRVIVDVSECSYDSSNSESTNNNHSIESPIMPHQT